MVGHAHYPALDGEDPLPATCSRTIVHGWLRERLDYDGLAISDDLEMGAVAPRDVEGQAAFEALSAGLDLLLYCSDLDLAEAAIERVFREAQADRSFARRVHEAASRVEVISRLWPAPLADLERFETARSALQRGG
jgi:beta-N-acetylhexosaminidase